MINTYAIPLGKQVRVSNFVAGTHGGQLNERYVGTVTRNSASSPNTIEVDFKDVPRGAIVEVVE